MVTAMSKATVTANFISPLLRHFNQPEMEADEDVRLFFSDIVEDLSQYPADMLALAAKKVRRSRMSLTFPPLAECLAACQAAHGELIKPEPRSEGRDYPEWSASRIAKANRLICCDGGRQAARDGWIVRLWDFCRENERVPNRAEAEVIIRKFRAAEAEFAENGIPLEFSSMRNAILSKRAQLSSMVEEHFSHARSQHIQPKPLSEAGDFRGDRRTADAPRY
jgi:hypothetical protein